MSPGEDRSALSGSVAASPILCKLTHSCKHWALHKIPTAVLFICVSQKSLVKFAFDLAHLALYVVRSLDGVDVKDYIMYQIKRFCDRQYS